MKITKSILILVVSLNRMFSNYEDQYTWLTSPHPDFDDNEPLRVLLRSKQGLEIVANYVFYTTTR